MSVATEFAPVVFIPERARPARPEATVTTLHAPYEASIAPPLRLTRRGILVVAALAGALAGAVMWLAALSAPAATAPATTAPARVAVHAGDTLWSIAGRVAPGSDPRAEVATLQRLNHLSGAVLRPGQVLRTR